MSEFGHRYAALGSGTFIDAWGAGPFIIEVGGKRFRFEDSDRFGPHLCARDGRILNNPWPSERSPFWRAHKAWREQGRRVAEDGVTCLFELKPLRPTVIQKIGRHWHVVAGGDEGGGYIKLDASGIEAQGAKMPKAAECEAREPGGEAATPNTHTDNTTGEPDDRG